MKNSTPKTTRFRLSCFLVLSLACHSLALASQNVYDAALHSTVFICSVGEDSSMTGSGVLIDKQRRLVITNEHVVHGGKRVIVFFPIVQQDRTNCDKTYYIDHAKEIGFEATVLAVDAQRDIALLQLSDLPEHAQEVEIGTSARPGQMVHSIGNPGASDALWVYTNGYVRANYYKTFDDSRMQVVETSSPTNPGDSGGPILNDEGQLVGITQSFMTTGRLVSNGVDISEITWFVNRVLNGGVVESAPAETGNVQSASQPSSQLINLMAGSPQTR